MNSVGIAECRETISDTEPLSQCSRPSPPRVASTVTSHGRSCRKLRMPRVGSCHLMTVVSTSIPSLPATFHGRSSSCASPHCTSQRRTCGNANAPPASCGSTCRRCNLLLAARAMRSAWPNARPLRSEKSVGCTMERMERSMGMPAERAYGPALTAALASPPRRVALHAARIGGGAAAAAVTGGGGEPALAPVRIHLDEVAALLKLMHGGLGQPALNHQHARPRRARPERDRKMLGVPGRRVDGFLQVHPGMDMPHE